MTSHPHSQAGNAANWTPEQFWEFVEGLTGEYERDQIRDMLAARGLVIAPAQCGVLTEEVKPEIIDNGRNPLIIVSPEMVSAWLTSIADAAGYSDRSLAAVQVKIKSILDVEFIRLGVPELVLMVSNIPKSRASVVSSANRGGE